MKKKLQMIIKTTLSSNNNNDNKSIYNNVSVNTNSRKTDKK